MKIKRNRKVTCGKISQDIVLIPRKIPSEAVAPMPRKKSRNRAKRMKNTALALVPKKIQGPHCNMRQLYGSAFAQMFLFKKKSPAEKMRKELQAGLAKFKNHFTKLKAKNWSPDKQELLVDMAFFPIAVKVENARKPEFNLHLFDSNEGVSNECFKSLMDDVKSGKLQNGRALFKLPCHSTHFVAADITTIDGKISILVLEPLSLNKNIGHFWQHYAQVGGGMRMSYLLPENAKLTVLSINALKSDFDCRIHALSAASKMAKESEFFDEIHKNNLSDQLGVVSEENKDWFVQENKKNGVSLKIEFVKKPASSSNQEIENNEQADSSLSTATTLNKDQRQPELLFVFPNVRIVDAHCLLPPSFQKHTQAMSSLEKLTDEKLTEPVNKKNDTLLSRFDKHAVERYKKIKNNEAGNSQQSRLKPIKFSASIEEKRLT